jgi:hypothetical protein
MNVRVAGRFDPMTKPSVLAVVEALQRQFEGRGRIVLRASGTEPVIRVMVEGDDAGLVKTGARDIAAAVEAVAAGDGVAGVGEEAGPGHPAAGEPGAGHPALETDAPVDEATAETWAGLAVTGRRS